jgi:Arc/MetJ family transcription regulator
MARTIIDIDDEKLARAQRALRTTTKRETVNAALELAAAVDARKRTELLEEFRDLLNRMNVDLIEHDEIEDHAGGAA